MPRRYKVTRTFTNGNLKGLTYTEETTIEYVLGKEYRAYGSSDYRITEIEVLV